MKHHLAPVIAIGLSISLTACFAGNDSDAIESSSSEKKTPKPPKTNQKCDKKPNKKKCATTTATIGPTGGTITTPDGLVLQVPYGAVDNDVTLSVTATTFDPDPEVGGAGTVYAFEPEGTIFVRPVDVTLPLPAGLTNPSVYWTKLGTSEFEPIGGTVAAGKITASTFHFSLAQVGVSPTRVIHGSAWTTWITEFARDSEPTTTLPGDVQLYTSDGNGGFAPPISSTITSAGEFEFSNIGPGDYIVKMNKQAFETVDRYLVASGPTIDLGTSRGGLRLREDQPGGLTLDLNVSFPNDGTHSSWNASSQLEMFGTQSDNWGFNLEMFDELGEFQGVSLIPVDAVSAHTVFDVATAGGLPWAPKRIAAGDNVIVAQLTGETSATGTIDGVSGVPYQSMRYIGRFPSAFDTSDRNDVAVDLVTDIRASPKTLDIDFRGDLLWAAIVAANPSANPTNYGYGVLAQGYSAEEGFYTGNGDLLLDFHFPATSCPRVITGPMHYGDSSLLATPGGHFGDLFIARCNGRTDYKLPHTKRAGNGAAGGNGFNWTRSVPSPGEVIGVPLTPPRNIYIDGHPFTSNGPLLGKHPTITWDPPSTGKDAAHCTDPDHDASPSEACVAYYQVIVRRMFVDGNLVSRGEVFATVVTPDTSFQFPDILDENTTYTFTIVAVGGTSGAAVRSLRKTPFRAALDQVDVRISSGIFGTEHGPLLDVQTIPTDTASLGIATTATHMYWLEYGDDWDAPAFTPGGKLWRAKLDGSEVSLLVDNLANPVGLAIEGDLLYWTNQADYIDGSVNMITLSDCEPGTCPVKLIADHESGLANEDGIVVKNGDVFWVGDGLRVVRGSDLCYTNAVLPCTVERLDGQSGEGIAIDDHNVYWSNYSTGEILQMSLTTNTVTTIATGGAQTASIRVQDDVVYFSNVAYLQPFPAFIWAVPRDNADPSSHTTIATSTQVGPWSLRAFDLEGSNAYYIDTFNTVMRAPLDGSGPQPVGPIFPAACPQGDAVVRNHVMYWTDTCTLGVRWVALP